MIGFSLRSYCFSFVSFFLFFAFFSFLSSPSFLFFFFSWDGIANRQRALTLRLIRRKNSVGKLISVNLDTIQFGWKRDTVSKMHRD